MTARKITAGLMLLFVALLILGTIKAALGEEFEHGWISNNELYKRADGEHCCGPEHCKPMPLDFVRETARGWFVPSTGQLFTETAKGLYYSKDWNIYACLSPERQVQCLFVQPGGA